MGYKSQTQNKNLAWYLPRPKPDRYKGGMPLYAEDWCIELAKDILENQGPHNNALEGIDPSTKGKKYNV